MCGIIGYTGSENSVPRLIEGLYALEYRGYDSAGIAVFNNSKIDIIKAKGRLKNMEQKLEKEEPNLFSTCGIGHTRWATHGEPSDINSHPHGNENVALVHNGIIENHAYLKSYLETRGYIFETQTDTEAAAKLLDYRYSKSHDPISAIRETCHRITGAYAFGIIFAEYPGRIYAVRCDSPLIVAPSEDGNFISSDIPAILKYTNKYYTLAKGEIAIIDNDKITFCDFEGENLQKELKIALWDVESARKQGYSHFMLKEINDEPEAVRQTVNSIVKDGFPYLDGVGLHDEILKKFERLFVVGCGTAMHAGLVGQSAIQTLSRIPVSVEISSEFRYNDPIITQNDLVIVISQSGETADTLAALRLAKTKGAKTLGIVNVIGSSVATEADYVIHTLAGPEIAVASTKAYSVQMAVMYVISLALSRAHNVKKLDEIHNLTDELLNKIPDVIKSTIALSEDCNRLAALYFNAKDLFFIGRKIDYALSQEASLKLKEISYIHSEAYAAGELKHGTISLITDGVPVVAFATCKDVFEKTVSNIREVKSRGAKVILVASTHTYTKELMGNVCDSEICLPECSELFSPLSSAVILQLFAYYTAVLRGCDVDKPRNLAKSVTVE